MKKNKLKLLVLHNNKDIVNFSLKNDLDDELSYNGKSDLKLSYVYVDMQKYYMADYDSRIKLIKKAIKNNDYEDKKLLTVGVLLERIKNYKKYNDLELKQVLKMPLFYTAYEESTDMTYNIGMQDTCFEYNGIGLFDYSLQNYQFIMNC